MPVASPHAWQLEVSPDIAECPLGTFVPSWGPPPCPIWPSFTSHCSSCRLLYSGHTSLPACSWPGRAPPRWLSSDSSTARSLTPVMHRLGMPSVTTHCFSPPSRLNFSPPHLSPDLLPYWFVCLVYPRPPSLEHNLQENLVTFVSLPST